MGTFYVRVWLYLFGKLLKAGSWELPMSDFASSDISFTRPELTRCIVVGVYKDRFTLVVATDEPCELSKTTLLDGDFSTTLSDIKLFDMVQADPRSHTIKFS